ncbi:MAG: hypothetical protein M1399_02710 [Actinobacteria bacterium]|nr:hypothetical protein [Actinomycetota bacterium]
MDRRDIVRQVARAASTGSSKSYKEKSPIHWYASLVLIVILGLLSIIYSRYELTRTTSSVSTPTKTTYAAFSFDICGKQLGNPPTNPNPAKAVLATKGDGIIHIPASAAKKGKNTLGNFVDSYPKMELASNTIRYPGGSAYHNGNHCPKGTPDSGKAGIVRVEQWASFKAQTGTPVSGNPTSLVLTNGMEVTMAFVPANASIPRPPTSVTTKMLTDISGVKPTPTSSTPSSGIPSSGIPTSSTPSSGVPTSSPPSSVSHPATSVPSSSKTSSGTNHGSTKP